MHPEVKMHRNKDFNLRKRKTNRDAAGALGASILHSRRIDHDFKIEVNKDNDEMCIGHNAYVKGNSDKLMERHFINSEPLRIESKNYLPSQNQNSQIQNEKSTSMDYGRVSPLNCEIAKFQPISCQIDHIENSDEDEASFSPASSTALRIVDVCHIEEEEHETIQFQPDSSPMEADDMVEKLIHVQEQVEKLNSILFNTGFVVELRKISNKHEIKTDTSSVTADDGNTSGEQTVLKGRKTLDVMKKIAQKKSRPRCLRPARPCLFCGKYQTHLIRHLKRMHKNEPQVRNALHLPKIERLQAISIIRKHGIIKEQNQTSCNSDDGSQRNALLLACPNEDVVTNNSSQIRDNYSQKLNEEAVALDQGHNDCIITKKEEKKDECESGSRAFMENISEEIEPPLEIDLDIDKPDSPSTPMNNGRRYRRWTQADSDKVISYFDDYVYDLNSDSTSKGALPPKKSIEKFLEHYSVFENENISPREMVSLVKTKVFNERKKNREISKKFQCATLSY